ncbi:class I SAM-dependent DNA methyltransferase [Novosphingobium sp. ES2-1]|uniref:class I SAM-dependent DNA methyltransferase n=1 Tax=Novosphingobium sp. ES2-1 TaxID=2780074 RepID=UPI00187ED21B|nr:class I SAM-dependent DNA methyltransferase [Novosphingobium sp. ES2-1]QOV93448.1 class I SAM-dependent DNA methyltransferase [Novosphingobium sp. ES2-1]
MTPHEFLSKWRHVELKERSASQSHFNDLCALLGVLDPIAADPKGEWFAFEKGATKTSGGEGWADVWRKGCFAWEYKGPRKDLDKAFSQLLQYAVALENPPLLIVSDMDRIRIHTNWTNTVQEVHEFTLDDLLDGQVRERLKRAFTDPEDFKPSKTRQALTEETAREFAGIAQRLRDRGHEAHRVAHFVNQLVFCMFAEDVGLLPDNLFTKMLDLCRSDPASFAENASTLFGAMAQPNGKVGFTRIDWFNGGLFANDAVLPVSRDDVEELYQAALRDWSQIDPSILGTLFERGLDPAKRSQLGAHYTDRDKIMMIVKPVIIDPLEAEWAEALAKMTALIESAPKRTAERLLTPAEKRRAEKLKDEAAAIHSAFIERLVNFRVLDPACGSGNFLYVALRALKDIEHRANLDAEALGLSRGFPRVGPECVLGIELNPYAAELARVSVWIGEIQWMRRNGFDAAKNPILRNLDTIECRDAVLVTDGHGNPVLDAEGKPRRASWPDANVVVGNPPFLGDKKMIRELGGEYATALRRAYSGKVPGGANMVCYWLSQANDSVRSSGLLRAGLVTTNAIRTGADRRVLEMLCKTAELFEAWSDEPWVVDGASVRVSMICVSTEPLPKRLDGAEVATITASLSQFQQPLPSPLDENSGTSFTGTFLNGPFEVSAETALGWLQAPRNVAGHYNREVIRLTANGQDLLQRGERKWLLDFGTNLSERDAALYEAPFEYARQHIQSYRQRRDENGNFEVRRQNHRERWWIHAEARPGMRRALEGLSRFIVTPMVSSTRVFAFLEPAYLPNQKLVVFPREDDTFLGLLSSIFHETWTLEYCSWIGAGNDPTYATKSVYQTFPFPEGLTPNIPAAAYADDPRSIAIAKAAARLNELRENWLNPPDLVVREPEVVPGYPDRILPKDEVAAKELAKRTLTNLYNARPAWLDHAHRALDEAVADAYGWGDDFRAGLLTDDEVLARLFRLNQERASR